MKALQRRLRLGALAAATAAVALAGLAPLASHALPAPAPSVAWTDAGADTDVDKAFAQARAKKKPVLLYWGAKWCPPCNQLKATLFNRQDFIEQSRNFVAVHIDGDLPGAQKLGTRFKVRGYPTLILFSPDGNEITRLPGEADAPQVMRVLQLGLAGGRPVKAVLADAQAGRPLKPNEWKLLAFYSWETDQDSLVPESERPGLLAQLAATADKSGADNGTTTRLWLEALASSNESQGLQPDAALRHRVLGVLANAEASRQQMDVLTNSAPDIVAVLAPDAGAERSKVVTAFNSALQRLEADPTLSRADRQTALISRIELARINEPKAELQPQMPQALQQEALALATREDREITDGYERQAVIIDAAYMLGRAGLWKDSDELLKTNLAKSHSPYYLMSHLGGNARKEGRNDEALHWYEEAFNTSEGPATRLQWGASYFGALVDLAPQDSDRIEKTAAQLLSEAAQDKSAFYERSARSLESVGAKLSSWNANGQHNAVLTRLRTQLDGVCSHLDASQKAICDGVIKAPKNG